MRANIRRVAFFIYHCVLAVAACAAFALTGCRAVPTHHGYAPPPSLPVSGDLPRELNKVVLPAYRIEPPDLLLIEAVNMVPRPPYFLRSLDIVSVFVQNTLPDAPIAGEYPIEPGGRLNLGPAYGTVDVGGMTVDQAKGVVEKHLKNILRDPLVTMSIVQSAGLQPIAGEHLVTPDGTVNLGTYGSVYVVGMTLPEARQAIERHLSQFLERPEVVVDVFSYNSKVYYVITEGAGFGDTVTRFPITGNETVLDAISNINGLTEVSSKKIWIARPTPNCNEVQILPVDYKSITAQGQTVTNYQILPGDRVFVAEDKLIAFDASLGKLLAPAERVMGFSILTLGTLSRFSGRVLQQGNGFGGGFGGFGGF